MPIRNPSKFKTSRKVDDPIVQDANYRFDAPERQYIDDQIRSLQQWAVDAAIPAIADREVVNFADADITLTDAQAAKGVIKITGSNATATRDLIFPALTSGARVYVIENWLTGANNVRLRMPTGFTWQVFPINSGGGGVTHVALFTPDGVTLLGPAGVPSSLGVQYINSSGYFTAIPIGAAGQVLKVNATATGYEWGAGGGGSGTTPTGTGFRHVTAGAEDAAAKLVVDADVDAAAAITPSKLAAGASGYVLQSVLGSAGWATIKDANIDAAAAIAGTKIAPDFGAQVVKTTGAIEFGAGTKPASGFVRLPYNGGAAVSIIRAISSAGAELSFLQYGAGDAWTVGNTSQTYYQYAYNSQFVSQSGQESHYFYGGFMLYDYAGSRYAGFITGNGWQLGNSSSADLGGGVGVFGIDNATTVPTTNATGGGILYAEAGALKWRGSGGTITTVGPADPHCPTCGRDFATEHRNDDLGEHVAVCLPCLIDAVAALGVDASKFAFVNKRAATKEQWDAHHAEAKAREAAHAAAEAAKAKKGGQ